MANDIEEASNSAIIYEDLGLTLNIDGPIIITKGSSPDLAALLRKAMGVDEPKMLSLAGSPTSGYRSPTGSLRS